ncbi:MAG: bifunctional nuclease family protein [Bacteroidetes bacterium]|nr:bifunctional nuclease family protein [Bacteroidota bacterium]
MDKKVQLKVFTLMAGHTHGSYNLVLQEVGGIRKIPIIVGTFEAQAIATEIEGITPQRPLTHDLLVAVLAGLDVELKEVLIYDLQNGVFFARLLLHKAGLISEIDARTSDAIAIALRTKSPIYIESHLNEKPSRPINSNDYSVYSKSELMTLLDEAVEAEDYIKAALIRDELNKSK